jgi:hypothetical protein
VQTWSRWVKKTATTKKVRRLEAGLAGGQKETLEKRLEAEEGAKLQESDEGLTEFECSCVDVVAGGTSALRVQSGAGLAGGQKETFGEAAGSSYRNPTRRTLRVGLGRGTVPLQSLRLLKKSALAESRRRLGRAT